MEKSGKNWVTWANTNAKNSSDISKLVDPFKSNVTAFIKALKEAGASVSVSSTRRSEKRAYLFHWSWKIYLEKAKPEDATKKAGVDIEWNHGDKAKSIAGAKEMVLGFGLAVPPNSKVAPSLTSNHISGKAIDMTITWKGTIEVARKGNPKKVKITYMPNANSNLELHKVGKSYGVIKHTSDRPHWSVTGR